MSYIETKINITPVSDDNFDILSALLGEIGYESFSQGEESLSAYIQSEVYDEVQLKNTIDSISALFSKVNYASEPVEDKNWNEEWEKNFEPILIDGVCLIKAPFHQIENTTPHEIIIEPKMSFGTGHHATTASMLRLMATINFNESTVLDMGCGTGVLAIFASQKQANNILAIDIDSWAYENTIENIERNNSPNIQVMLGGAELLNEQKFNIVVANINRNILLNDMDKYVKTMLPDSKLLLSGFYTEDLPLIKEKATELGLEYNNHIVESNWVAALFTN